MKICQQDISKRILLETCNLFSLLELLSKYTDKLLNKFSKMVLELWSLKKTFGISNLSASYLKKKLY